MKRPIRPPASAKTIFLRALEISDPEQRDEYLTQACGDDDALRDEVDRLLAARDGEHSNLFSQAVRQLNPDASPSACLDAVSQLDTCELVDVASHPVIDRYKLLEEIGRGGMGTVYMAQQLEPVKRRVALKVINPGMDSREVVARFEAERQALAMMDHPNISRVFDGGTTAEGRPYFVMELVHGVPITRYCEQQQLGLDERLQLFMDVCHAVQHAHQKGIIHRDLKPSNVQITNHDDKPVVKVIDFGVAKALHQELTDRTLYTQFNQLVGTPLYMSPEQADRHGLDIDTRSDVYSLGVLLYELLTGTTPFDREELSAAGIDGARRMICEQEPPRPSLRVSTLELANDSTLESPPKRLATFRMGSSALRGDIDWIVMKALEKNRNNRYESASSLADDVQRYLWDEPVVACPPSLAYRSRKFIERNRTLVALFAAGAIGVAATIAATIAALAYGLNQAAIERDNAQQAAQYAEETKQQAIENAEQAQRARDRELEALQAEAVQRKRVERALEASEEVVEFFSRDVLGKVTPHARTGTGYNPQDDLTLREALDHASERVDSRFSNHPEAELQVRFTLGVAYGNLGVLQQAIKHLKRADELASELEESDAQKTLLLRQALANFLHETQQHEQAITILEELLIQHEEHGFENRADWRDIHVFLADCYSACGMHDNAIRLARQFYEEHRRVTKPDDFDRATSANALGLALYNAGRYADAIPYHKEALERCRQAGKEEMVARGIVANNLAIDYGGIENFDLATKYGKVSLEARTSVWGPNHPGTICTLTNLAHMLARAERLAEAAGYAQLGVDRAEAHLEANHPERKYARIAKARVDGEQGRLAEAIRQLQEFVPTNVAASAGKSKDNIGPRNFLGRFLLEWGDPAQAVKVLESAAKDAEDLYDSLSHATVVSVRRKWAAALMECGEIEEATAVGQQTLTSLQEAFPADHKDTLLVQSDLALTEIAGGNTDHGLKGLADAWQQTKDREHGQILAELYFQNDRVDDALSQVEKNLAEVREKLPEGGLVLADALADSATLLQTMQRADLAEPLLREAMGIRQSKLPDLWKTYLTQCQLGQLLSSQGEIEEAEALLLEGCRSLKQCREKIPLSQREQHLSSLKAIVELYETKGDTEQAEHWRGELAALS